MKTYATFIFIGVILCIAGYGGLVLYLTWPIEQLSVANAGTFGDSFGVTTSLFSGLAFAGIILTILLQRQELTESREIFRIQRFEGSFYRLLELYRKNLDDIRIIARSTNEEYRGVDALCSMCKRLSQTMLKHSHFLEVAEDVPLYEAQLFVEVQRNLSRQARYLGTLQNLLQLIERDLSEISERLPYWHIVASQLTSHEAKYIFYCCLVSDEQDALRELVHRSNMICSRIGTLNISSFHRALYERLHGVSIPRSQTKLVMPYSHKEFGRLKRRAAKRHQQPPTEIPQL